MKPYSEHISKLHEAENAIKKIAVGKTYVSKKGNKLTINEIFIDAQSMNPDVMVVYSFETENGQKAIEENRFTVVVDMLRNS